MDSDLNELGREIDKQYFDDPVLTLVEIMKLDKDNNGSVSMKELDSAFTDPKIKREDAARLVAAKHYFKMIAALVSNDKSGDSEISADDLEELVRQQQLKISAELLQGKLASALDRNQDSVLSKEELEDALRALPKDGPSAFAVNLLLSEFEKIRVLHDDGDWVDRLILHKNENISSDDLRTAAQRLFGYRLSDLGDRVTASMKDSIQVLEIETRSLYEKTDGKREPIRPEAIKQGAAGSCWWLAALASAHPESIKSMIKQNPDGTFTFTSPLLDKRSGKPFQVTVPPPTDAELAYFARLTPHGTWAAVLEKALAQTFKDNPERKGELTGTAFPPDANLAQEFLWGASNAFAIELITGRPAVRLQLHRLRRPPLSLYTNDGEYREHVVDHLLTAAIKDKTPVTAGSGADWPRRENGPVRHRSGPSSGGSGYTDDMTHRAFDHKDETPDDDEKTLEDLLNEEPPAPSPFDPTTAGHAFSVIDYDPETRTVTVRNPFGSGELVDNGGKPLDGSNDGVMRLPLKQFLLHFDSLCINKHLAKS